MQYKTLKKVALGLGLFTLGQGDLALAQAAAESSAVSSPDNEGSLLSVNGEAKTSGNLGALSVSRSFPLPTWRNLFPELSFSYSSQGGHSELGYGWSMPIPSISLDRRLGLPNNGSTLVSDLDGRLRPLSNNQVLDTDKKLYRPRIDNSGNLYLEHNKDGRRYFEVQMTGGNRYIFGEDSNSREESDSLTTTWMLSKIIDPYDNAVVFKYFKDRNVAYLESIAMVNGQGREDESTSYVVDLVYEDRNDTWVSYGSGLIQGYYKRLSSVSSYGVTGLDEESTLNKTRIAKMVFSYEEQGPSRRSILTKTEYFGSQDTDITPNHSYQYTADTYRVGDFNQYQVQASGLPLFSRIRWHDFNRDGLVDIFALNGTEWNVWYNLGRDQGFSAAETLPIGSLQLDNGIDSFVDINKDFSPDLVTWDAASRTQGARLSSRESGLWSSEKKEVSGLPKLALGATAADWVDYDNDRAVDFVRYQRSGSNLRLWVYRNTSNGDELSFASPQILNLGSRITVSPDQLNWADFNGDGLEDIYHTLDSSSGSRILAYLSSGQLIFPTSGAQNVSLSRKVYGIKTGNNRPFRARVQLNVNSRLADLNSDGFLDLVYYGPKTLRIFYGTGKEFQETRVFPFPDLIKDPFRLEIADMNGNGSQDLVLLSQDNSGIHVVDHYSDDSNSAPYMMSRYINESGHESSFTYRSSNLGKIAKVYGASWFPMITQVVTSVREWATVMTDDQGLAFKQVNHNEFDYDNPRYDVKRKEFLGFQKVQVKLFHDASAKRFTREDLDFLTDESDSLMKGHLKSRQISYVDLENPSSNVDSYEEDSYQWQVLDLVKDDDVHRTVLKSQSQTMREGEESRTNTRNMAYTVSDEGLVSVVVTEELSPSGEIYRSKVDEYFTTSELGRWSPGLVKSTRLIGASGQVLARTDNFVDDKLSLLRTERLRGGLMEAQESLVYDAYGNLIESTDPLGYKTTMTYDDPGAFNLTSITKSAGKTKLIRSMEWSELGDLLLATIDENGQRISFAYDGLSRQISTTNPGQSEPVETRSYQFGTKTSFGFASIQASSSTRPSIGYIDGLGRPVGNLIPVGSQDWIITDWQSFDQRGLPRLKVSREALSANDSIETWKPDLSIAKVLSWDYQGRAERLLTPSSSDMAAKNETTYSYRIGQVSAHLELGERRDTFYDHFGRVYRTEIGGSEDGQPRQAVKVFFDRQDRVEQLITHQGITRSYSWDELGRMLSAQSEFGRQTLTYNQRGDLTLQNYYDSQNQLLGSYETIYDSLARPTIRYRQDADQNKAKEFEWFYDQRPGSANTSTYTKGRIASLCMADGSCLDYDYHPLGMTARKTLRIANPRHSSEHSLGFEYDQYARLSKIIYPNLETTALQYSPHDGQVTSVSNLIKEIKIDRLGRLLEMAFTDSVKRSYNYYKNLMRLKTRIDTLGAVRSEHSYIYNALDRITEIKGGMLWYKSFQKDFSYDQLGRLSKATYQLFQDQSEGVSKEYNYGFDSQGRMSNFAGKALSYNYSKASTFDTYLSSIAVDDQVHSFDPAGRLKAILLADGMQELLSWSPDNQLRSKTIGNDEEIHYQYLPNKMRFSETTKKTDGTSLGRVFHWDDLVSYDERNDESTYHYKLGSTAIATRTGDEDLRYVINDHLGSVLGTVSAAGEILDYHDYDPYGQVIRLGESWDFHRDGYAGAMGDWESASYQMQHRHFLPGLGQFMSPDPSFLMQPARCLGRIKECDLYSYVGFDPVNFVDPTGLEGESDSEGEDYILPKTEDTTHYAEMVVIRGDQVVKSLSLTSGKETNEAVLEPYLKPGKTYKDKEGVEKISSGFNRSLVHTEKIGLLSVKDRLEENDLVVFDGVQAPCTGCKGAMARAANGGNIIKDDDSSKMGKKIRIQYNWRVIEGSKVVHYMWDANTGKTQIKGSSDFGSEYHRRKTRSSKGT
ncbi:FG-GAP-like repeat-containing protein [Pseudobacteriovorax antillogorgiicola]|uniref:RHS repeat-associated core domain-containing protein n=1 Tax=Pseudobacteriovorax antillogorgiicola TaxID=1513793 RepID=A0A1Y6C1Y3_9BACT|nr:FG-GAP-like repeat-containing protein [Pseudobacteriovorax antillogorgiicola]TCS50767.1 RHS repeat-associated protein [Pseudobacteriovorax antillogorgiicola]SMF41259.1 RHS repeat-associated core domain-containing protein [Pseudobacteriovorax antillogorgiicola]